MKDKPLDIQSIKIQIYSAYHGLTKIRFLQTKNRTPYMEVRSLTLIYYFTNQNYAALYA